jgi:translation initiation factor 5
MEINMNGNLNDTNYRYTMPQFSIIIAGKGNGVYTIINNMSEISKAINHPEEVIFKYIATVTGSNYIKERNTITGSHDVTKLTSLILEYIKYLVICPKCNIPETIPTVSGNKKNTVILLNCSACKSESQINSSNKYIEKGQDIIIKYLKSDKDWKLNKGSMVLNTELSDEDELNPFNI